jgi:rSAM/selenodomain-associated transferase 2
VKIAVIIPTLNEEQALPDTLASVTQLGFDEILVVDGGSGDRTQAIVQSLAGDGRWAIGDRQKTGFSEIVPAHSPLPMASSLRLLTAAAGRAKQMNAGAAHSRADVLLFLHADTRLPDGARRAIERALHDPACAGGRFDVRFERDAGLAWLIARMISLRSRWSGIATGDQALFVRRSIFEQLGGFADLPIMEDVDFTRRLKRAGRVAPLRGRVVTSSRRWERCGAVRTIFLMWTLRFLYWIGVAPDRLHRFYTSVR